MNITRNRQQVSFTTDSTDADIVQTSEFLNSAQLPIPVKDFLIGGVHVMASTGPLARQAIREHKAQTDAAAEATATDLDETLGELLSAVDDVLQNALDQGYYHDNLRTAIDDYRKVRRVTLAPAVDAYTPPTTWHPGRCFCPKFAPGHIPGLEPRYGSECTGDTDVEHDASSCGACMAGATDYRPRIEAGQTWISNRHGTDHQVQGPGDEIGTWAMWGPVGNLYVISDARLYTAYTLDLDR